MKARVGQAFLELQTGLFVTSKRNFKGIKNEIAFRGISEK